MQADQLRLSHGVTMDYMMLVIHLGEQPYRVMVQERIVVQ